VLMEQEYAETDKPAIIYGKKTTIKSTGMNAYLGENRLELLNNVYTKILP
jgi:lipopolysaccharide export system protein LptC